MAATDCMESSNLITCPTCDHSVSQNRGNKRIICPKCGNFYDRDSAVDELRQIRRVNREKQSPNEIKDRDEVMFLNLDYTGLVQVHILQLISCMYHRSMSLIRTFHF